jgi:CheY-like chemotaxis protein
MKILFVDDDAMNRRVVKDMLSVVGAQMDEADCGESGLQQIDERDYHVILMDLRMPGMDGLTATRHIRQRSDSKANVPIIVVTADTSTDLAERCASAGADCVLMKPVAMASLIDTIGQLMARNSSQSIVLH